MNKNKNISCVIFDCDGVLVDSEKLCCQALSDVFNRFGVSTSQSDFLAHFQGGKLADMLSEAKTRLGLNVSVDTLEPLYRRELEKQFEKGLKPIDGVIEVLDKLDDLNISYCVVSNSPSDKIEHMLELTGLNSRFVANRFSAFDANSWKPDPDLLRYAVMNMGYTTSECVYIDDTLKGVEAGVGAGIRTFYFRPNADSEQTQFKDVVNITDIRELKAHCIN